MTTQITTQSTVDEHLRQDVIDAICRVAPTPPDRNNLDAQFCTDPRSFLERLETIITTAAYRELALAFAATASAPSPEVNGRWRQLTEHLNLMTYVHDQLLPRLQHELHRLRLLDESHITKGTD